MEFGDREMLIGSLTSIPPRFPYVGRTLESLLNQTAKPDQVHLYIPDQYRRFPDWDGALPEVPDGVEICRTQIDLGPATKVLPAVQEFGGQNVLIAFFDDDRIYDRRVCQRLIAQASARPDCCIAENGYHLERITGRPGPESPSPRAERRWRITDIGFQLRYLWQDIRAGARRKELREPPRRVNKRSGYIDILEGSGGALVRPSFFDARAFDIPPVLWSVDDVWLSGMLAANSVPIWLPANILEQDFNDGELHAPLRLSVNEGADRDTANQMAVDYMQKTFGVWAGC